MSDTPLRLDNVYDIEQLRQFASQVKNSPITEVEKIKNEIDGGQSKDFYYGVLSALAFSWQYMAVLDYQKHKQKIGISIAVIADHILNKGKT